MAKVAVSLLARSKQAMIKKKQNPSWAHTYCRQTRCRWYVCMRPLTLCDNFVPFHHVHICRCCCWHFSSFFFSLLAQRQTAHCRLLSCMSGTPIHMYVCMSIHTHAHTHVVMYKGQHKSETGIVTKREFDLLRIRRGCQGHPATACGAAFPYILHLKGE